MDRTILHLDLDAFYASVEQLDNPALRKSPVIVGGDVARGVVSAASYEARACGVHSAMPMAKAVRLCPEATVLPVRMDRYRGLSGQVFAVYHEFTDLVEPLSIDEAFLDVTGSQRLFGSGMDMARTIRRRVRERTGLTVSVGIAPNKFLAKMASERAKPDGIFKVRRERIDEFLLPLPVGDLWGIGKVSAARLENHGLTRIEDLAKATQQRLTKLLGNKLGEQIFRLARGIDDRRVEPGGVEKSIGAEKTYPTDIRSQNALEMALLALAEEVGQRVRKADQRGHSVTLKVRYDDFTTVTRSTTRTPGLQATRSIYRIACELMRKTEAGSRPVRLLGITLSQLENVANGQCELFADQHEGRSEKLDGAVDALRRKYGSSGVVRGTLLKKPYRKD